jgi:hypothetical protein
VSRQAKRLQLAEFEKLLPIAVNFLLGLLDHPLIAGLEHVGEAALGLQVLLYRQLVLGLVAQAMYYKSIKLTLVMSVGFKFHHLHDLYSDFELFTSGQ